jgi:dTDP-D-glucose 4,6-dehydratase
MIEHFTFTLTDLKLFTHVTGHPGTSVATNSARNYRRPWNWAGIRKTMQWYLDNQAGVKNVTNCD